MSYVIDIIIVLILIFTTWSGYKKGVVKSLTDLFGAVAAAVLASAVAVSVSDLIYESFVREGVYNRVFEILDKSDPSIAVRSFFETLPTFVIELLEGRGITQASLVDAAVGTSEVATNAIVDAVAPVFILIIQFFALIILFILFIIVIKALSGLLTGILKFPVLAQLNQGLGSVFGLLFGLVIAWLFVITIQFGSGLIGEAISAEVVKAFEDSVVSNLILNYNPFSYIVS